MDLFSTFANYASDSMLGERAVFEAAMLERIRSGGYKMSDLMYEVFQCQKHILILELEVKELTKKKAPPKKKSR